jgi:hypothetical protein
MDDWVAAIVSVKNRISKDAVVKKDSLHCNRGIAASALQKAIRRNETLVAQQSAFQLHEEDRSTAWRRLIAIPFEDVGVGDIDLVIETVAAAVSPDWRRQRRLHPGLRWHRKTDCTGMRGVSALLAPTEVIVHAGAHDIVMH